MKKTYYIDKVEVNGKIKYIYEHSTSPQKRYCEKMKALGIKPKVTEIRKQYLRKYYLENREQMIKNALYSYYRRKEKENAVR